MAIPTNIKDLEKDKFIADADGNTAVNFSDSNPASDNHTPTTVVDTYTSKETDGTNTYQLEQDGYAGCSFDMLIDAGSGTMTVTIQVSNTPGVTAATATYNEATNTLYGVASFTASEPLIDNLRAFAGYKYIQVTTVSNTAGANDAGVTMNAKQFN